MNPIIVALDVPTLEEAGALARQLVDDVGGFKVGLELVTGVGPSAITTIADFGKPVFADVKLHDIPNTVERAARQVAAAGARWMTVHAAGGSEMMRAAVAGMNGPGVLAVTVLTSLSLDDLASVGIGSGAEDQIKRLTALAVDSGVEGLICSPADVGVVRSAADSHVIFSPGIRLANADRDDQKRVATPRAALEAGADYLVIGRPITRSPDPVRTTREIAASLARFV